MAARTEGEVLSATSVQELDRQFEAHRAGLVRLCASMVGVDEADDVVRGRSAAFSPDGRRLAVHRDGGVWTMAADGSEALLAIPASFVDGFAWSPDGGSLVVASDYPNGGATGISIVRIDDAAPAVAGLVPGGHAPSWQPVLLDPPPAD